MSHLHSTAGGDNRPHSEHPLGAYDAALYALTAARRLLSPSRDERADAAFLIADLRERGFDLRRFDGRANGGADCDAAVTVTGLVLAGLRNAAEDARQARPLLTELRNLGWDVGKARPVV